jgi:hypothetical protein
MIAKNRSDFDGIVAGHVESVSRNGKGFSITFAIAEGLRGIAELDGNYKIGCCSRITPDKGASLRRELWFAPTVVFASLIALEASACTHDALTSGRDDETSDPTHEGGPYSASGGRSNRTHPLSAV